MKFALVAAFFLLWPSSSPAQTSDFDPNDKWWECIHFFGVKLDDATLAGRLVRNVSYDGSNWSETYEMWSKDIRVTYRVDHHQSEARPQVYSVRVNIPATSSNNGQGIYGYLFGDGELLAQTSMLSPRSAAKNYVASRAFFQNRKFRLNSWNHDLYGLIVLNGDGSEIIRKNLSIPSQAELDAAYLTHSKSIKVAWTKRDPEKLTTTPADSLPKDQANCLLSTPAARDEEELGSI